MRLLLLFVTMVMIVNCVLNIMDCEEIWNMLQYALGKWLVQGKIRMEIRAYIAKHNHLLKPPYMSYYSYFLKMNNFGDLLHSEFEDEE